jgi:hypothetical protein
MKFSKDNVSDCEEILSTQEEADTRIILQSMFVNQQMAKRNSNGRKNDDVVSHPVRE